MKKELSRRSFLGSVAVSPLLLSAFKAKEVSVGLELYSVREQLAADLLGTVRAVAELGYQGVEFYSPYFQWSTSQAKDVRNLLDDLGIECYSTHNSARSFDPENIDKAIELNQIIGSKIIVMASAGRVDGLDGWKKVAEKLNNGAAKMKSEGLRAGFHNHDAEFRMVEGDLPMNVLAKETTPDIVLQLDVGTCLEAGRDPVEWIESHPGRIASVHCKDWSSDPDKGYKVLFGEGAADWKRIFEAAEKVGGVEHYLIEQEGSAYPPMETAKRCLESFRNLRS
ncbi:MAG: sugar phosphate isomerase/epimerase [Acidobacteriota bacterium]|nr:MAG: sugar phosphate isomerase/epimerase [Acidobacteriota bacterium]